MFFFEALDNQNLWTSQKARDKLSEIAWSLSKQHDGDMDMVNQYQAYEKNYMEQYPEWFLETDVEPNESPRAIALRTESLLASISEKVDVLIAERELSPKRWWR
ncbi:hypothetical protein D9M68_835730 [compost metagenome]